MHSRKASSLWVELTTMTLFETTRKKLKKIFSVQESSIYCMQNDVGLPLNSQTTVKLAGESRFRHRRITSSHSKCKDKSANFTSRSRKSRRSQCKIRGILKNPSTICCKQTRAAHIQQPKHNHAATRA